MKKLLLIILTLSHLYSVELITSGNIELSSMLRDGEKVNLLDLNINNDLHFENSKFVTALGLFYTDNKVYNNNVKMFVNESESIRINELYYTQYVNNNLSFSFGLFPFKKGTFYEYGFNGNRSGIGLYTLSDAQLQGGIVTYNKDNYTLQIGSVVYLKYFKPYKDYAKTDNEVTFDSYKDSGMDYITYKYTRDKWYSELMLTNTYQYVNNKKIIDTDTYSLALSYDDEISTGRTYYTIYTYSDSKGDTSSLSPLKVPFSTDYYHFDKFNTKGYSLLLGFKQELDNVLFNKDMVFGLEYLHRSKGYHSLLAGEPFSYDSYSNIGDSYNIHTGIRFNKNTILKLRYYHYDNNGVMTKPMLSTVTTDENNGDSTGSYDSWTLQLYIDF